MNDPMAEDRYRKFLANVTNETVLSATVDDKHVKRIAKDLSKWETEYFRFDIDYERMTEIRSLTPIPLLQKIEFLRTWRDRTDDDTYGALLRLCAYTAMSNAATTIVNIANGVSDNDEKMAQKRLVKFQQKIINQAKLEESMKENIHTSRIANKLDKWEANYYYFRLTPSDVKDIKEIQNPRSQRIEVLMRWMEEKLGNIGDLLKICADTEMSDCAREIVAILNADDTNSAKQDDGPSTDNKEKPLKDSNCPEIRNPKPAVRGVDYKSFCDKVDFVFSVVNDNEFNAATTIISSPDIEGDPTQLTEYGEGIYVGMISNHPVGVIRHPPGRGCADMLAKGVQCFPNANFVINVGVCYGFQRDVVKFADVLVSTEIQDLGPFRITKDHIQPRGPLGTMTDKILAIFGNPDEVEGSQVSSDRRARHLAGKIASVSILIDYADLKEKIHNAVGAESLGGEMEGGELLRLQLKGVEMPDGSKKTVNVMIIKAVVDYADGTKDKRWQFMGAQAAFEYIQKKMALI